MRNFYDDATTLVCGEEINAYYSTLTKEPQLCLHDKTSVGLWMSGLKWPKSDQSETQWPLDDHCAQRGYICASSGSDWQIENALNFWPVSKKHGWLFYARSGQAAASTCYCYRAASAAMTSRPRQQATLQQGPSTHFILHQLVILFDSSYHHIVTSERYFSHSEDWTVCG